MSDRYIVFYSIPYKCWVIVDNEHGGVIAKCDRESDATRIHALLIADEGKASA